MRQLIGTAILFIAFLSVASAQFTKAEENILRRVIQNYQTKLAYDDTLKAVRKTRSGLLKQLHDSIGNEAFENQGRRMVDSLFRRSLILESKRSGIL
jgi:Skp family chaperone for outer membrane proteins